MDHCSAIGDTISCHAPFQWGAQQNPFKNVIHLLLRARVDNLRCVRVPFHEGVGGAWTALAAIVCDTPMKHVATGVV